MEAIVSDAPCHKDSPSISSAALEEKFQCPLAKMWGELRWIHVEKAAWIMPL